jgi:hypothetical protein
LGKNLGKHIIVGNTTKRSRKLDSVCAREGRFGSSGVVAAAVVARGGASVGARCTNMRRIGGGTPLFVWMWGVHAIPHRALQVVGRTLRMSQWRRIPLIFLQDTQFSTRVASSRVSPLTFPLARGREEMGCQASRPQVDGEGEALAFCTAAGHPQYAPSFARAGYDNRVTLAALTDEDLETVRELSFFFSVGRCCLSFGIFGDRSRVVACSSSPSRYSRIAGRRRARQGFPWRSRIRAVSLPSFVCPRGRGAGARRKVPTAQRIELTPGRLARSSTTHHRRHGMRGVEGTYCRR